MRLTQSILGIHRDCALRRICPAAQPGSQRQQENQRFLSISLFHEVARVLLLKWKEPGASSVQKADELATVLMVMLNQQERASRVCSHLIENPSSFKPLTDLSGDERHPLSVERARNVLKWMEDREIVRKWQKTLIPHMQTALLKRLKQKPTSWTDLPLVEKELARRASTPV